VQYAYLHGVFGRSLSAPLARGIWKNLACAEAQLREREGLSWQVLDFDGDGHDEIWGISPMLVVLKSLAWRAIEELTLFASGINFAGVLTRRLEAYHVTATDHLAQPELAMAARRASTISSRHYG